MQSKPQSNPFFQSIQFITALAKTFWKKRTAINELAECDALDLARIAQDLGVSAADLRVLATRDKRAADLLYRRLESIRLDPTSVDRVVMRDLQRCCSNCDSKPLCAHELEDKPLTASWPKYCPNQETLDALGRKPRSPE
jgi:hypothetical protein